MKALLSFLWSGCWHRWEIIAQGPLFGRTDAGGEGRIGTAYDLQCQRCGTVKGKHCD